MEATRNTAIYPIGKYKTPDSYDEATIADWINAIEALPSWLDVVVENLDEHQLQTSYRDGGWTIHQIIHHIADSHLNAYIRLKLALTEDNPTIKPYDENLWAVLPDVAANPVNISITLLHALHRRWVSQLRGMKPEEWTRTFFHPEQDRSIPLWEYMALYAWHGRHHMEQIRGLRERKGW